MHRITLACGPYDRTEGLRSGEVRVEGVDLTYLSIDAPREIFDRMAGRQEFDVSELSASEFIVMAASGRSPFVGIPVFVSRVFRHGFIYVNRDKGIAAPRDLAGRRIGVPLYTQTAAVWARHHLAEQYGVDLSGVTWVQGALEAAGSHGTPREVQLLQPVRIEQNHSGTPLEVLLAEGEIDALICARAPKAHRNIARLFPNYVEVEKDFYLSTRIFPIMHLIAIRRDVHEAAPWLGSSLFKAFTEAKDLAWRRLNRFAAPPTMLPWAVAEIDELNERLGGDPWPYGIEPNRPTLDGLMRAMVSQHLIAAPVPLDDLFLPV
jgi:4,5-dihydroxyphthalate decarboxylase